MRSSTVTLPALSLWQPWASLWASGIKPLETRHFPAPAALLAAPMIAIHAAARRPSQREWKHIVQATLRFEHPDSSRALGLIGSSAPSLHDDALPFGTVIAVGRLIAAYPFQARHRGRVKFGPPRIAAGYRGPLLADVLEDPWGDYTPGRWGWQIADIRELPEPIPTKGRQMIGWPCELPAHLLETVDA